MSVIFESIAAGDLTGGVYLACLGTALLCGVITAVCTCWRSNASRSFFTCLAVLPMIVCTVIVMVNGNVGTGIAVAGAFSLVRFRSVPGKARDIAAIFLAMTAGLACASGYVGIALVLTAAVCAVMLALSRMPLTTARTVELHITVPETLNIHGAFDDLFRTYTNSHRLVKTRTTNMGSLYKLLYHIELKDAAQVQAFIDDLRCRNGNLEISVCEILEGSESL